MVKPGVYGVKGEVLLNRQPMKRGLVVKDGDAIESKRGEAVVMRRARRIPDPRMGVSPDVTYICACYGEAQLSALSDAAQTALVRTTYHDPPRKVR